MWPFKRKPEKRAGYSDALIEAAFTTALGAGDANPLYGAALESAAGLWARCFAMATGGEPYFDATNLSWIARQLCRHGEAVLLIEPGERLRPVINSSITGGSAESTWRYQVDIVGPATTLVRHVSAHQLVHVRYAESAAAPWRGLSPLEYASTTGKLSAGLERALTEEAGANVGYVLPVPAQDAGSADDSDPLAALRNDIKNLRGRIAMVSTVASGWSEGRAQAPQRDWEPRRLGANPPLSLVNLRFQAVASVLAACGVNPVLVGLTEGGASQTALREAFREFTHTTVGPIARLIEAEASRKLGTSISFGFDELYSADVQGRARAFQSMVGGGMDVERAAALSGLLVPDETE